MLKKMFIKKAILILATSFALFLMYIIPNDNLYKLKPIEQLEYTENDEYKSVVYLLDKNNYVCRTKVAISGNDTVSKAKNLLEVLIKDGKMSDKVPSGFKAIIPSDTKINSISFENGLIKVDFSSSLMEVQKSDEEKVIEAIIYTLTSIDEVENIIIYIDGEILTKLPKSGINLPSTLNREFGINKEYDISSYKGVNKVTIYYVGKNNDESYYIPVTKYLNDDREKIKVIVDELASSYLHNSNLMSFLNSNTKLLATEKEMDSLFLVFNDYIFNDMNTKNILEEVIYTISLSVADNYDVSEVIFSSGDEEIYKSVLKTIENS